MKLLRTSFVMIMLCLLPTATYADMHKEKGMEDGGMMMGMMGHKQMMKMHEHMQKMQELMSNIKQEKDPDKHRHMMNKHMEGMQEGMNMMRGRQCESEDDDSPCNKMSDMNMDNRMNMMEKRMNMMQMMMDQMMQHQKEEESGRMHNR